MLYRILSERGWVSRLVSQSCVPSAVLFCVWCTAVILSWRQLWPRETGVTGAWGAWHPLHHNTAGGCCRSYQLTAASETMQDVSTQSTLASPPCLVMVSRWVITGGLGSTWTRQTSQTQPTWQCPAPPALATWTRPSTGRWPRSVLASDDCVASEIPSGAQHLVTSHKYPVNVAGVIKKAIIGCLLQGVFIMSISTVIGSVMALFICLNVINECKVRRKKRKQDVINNWVKTSQEWSGFYIALTVCSE